MDFHIIYMLDAHDNTSKPKRRAENKLYVNMKNENCSFLHEFALSDTWKLVRIYEWKVIFLKFYFKHGISTDRLVIHWYWSQLQFFKWLGVQILARTKKNYLSKKYWISTNGLLILELTLAPEVMDSNLGESK